MNINITLGAIVYKDNKPYTITAINTEYVILDDDIKVDIDTILNEYTLEGDLVLTPPQLLYKSEED